MPVRWTRKAALAAKSPLRLGIALGIIAMIGWFYGIGFGPAPADAALDLPETPDIDAPSTPNVESPSTPPTLPAAPVPARVPSLPRAPSGTPSALEGAGAPSSSQRVPVPSSGSETASRRGGDPSSIQGEFGDANLPAGRSLSADGEGAGRVAAAAHSGRDGIQRLRHREGSIQAAKTVSLRHLLAYVWPAIALGPFGELLVLFQAQWWPGALPWTPGTLPTSSRVGVAGLSETGHPPGPERPSSNPGSTDSPGIRLPSGDELSIVVLVVALAALIALLAFTVRRELGSVGRWHL